MAVDFQRHGLDKTQGSTTVADGAQHPVHDLLKELGFDVSRFPVVRCVLETSEKDIRVGRMIFPLRVPAQPGYVYDSIARITRTLEIPQTGQKSHRKFLEIEWVISEIPTIDEDNHAALSFLAAQLECVWCHEPFIPDPEVINESSVRISCPNCLNYWSVSVASQSKKSKTPELLLDLFQRDMAKLKKFILRWTDGPVSSHDKNYFQYFPFNFEGWTEQTSKDLLFEDSFGWTSLSNGGAKDFESLFRGFINSLSVDYLRTLFASMASSQLEQTEIQRKTDVAKKEEAARLAIQEIIPTAPPAPSEQFEQTENTPTQKQSAAMAGSQRFSWAQPTTQVKEFDPATVPPPSARPGVSKSLLAAGLFFAAVLIGAILVVTQESTPVATSLSSNVTPSAQAPEATTTQVLQNQSVTPLPAEVTPSEQSTEAMNQQILAAREIVRDDNSSKSKVSANAKKKSQRVAQTLNREQVEIVDSAFRQGMLHLKLQQAREAISEFQKVLALNPKHAGAHRGLGLAEVYEQNFDNAIRALSQYLELSRNPYDKDSVEELIATLKERTTKQ